MFIWSEINLRKTEEKKYCIPNRIYSLFILLFIHTHIHAYTHTYIHTHTHTYTHIPFILVYILSSENCRGGEGVAVRKQQKGCDFERKAGEFRDN